MHKHHLDLGCVCPMRPVGTCVHSGRRLQDMLALPFSLSPSVIQMGLSRYLDDVIALSMWGAEIPCESFTLSALFPFTWLPLNERDILSFPFLPPKCDSAITLSCVEVTSDLSGLDLSLFAGLAGCMEPTCPPNHLN